MVNAQEYINKKFPTVESKINCHKLNIGKKDENNPQGIKANLLEGSLDLTGFTNLKTLWCGGQQITELKLNDCSKLRDLECWDNKITHLDLDNCPKLEGLLCNDNQLKELSLQGLTNLEELNCSKNQLINLKVDKCSNLLNINCSDNKLNNLNLKDLVNLKKIICYINQLTSLDLNNLTKLEEINCNLNQLTSLDLSSLARLKKLICRNNRLTSINYPVLSSKKLTDLSVMNNKLPEQDLTVFSKFTGLENLWIGNSYDKERAEQGVYNRFVGSLKPLKKLNNLRVLDISSTDIDSGLEYLTESLEKFNCSVDQRPEAEVKKIRQELANYAVEGKNNKFNFSAWHQDNKQSSNLSSEEGEGSDDDSSEQREESEEESQEFSSEIKLAIKDFFAANSDYEKSDLLYDYKVVNYEYEPSRRQHQLTIKSPRKLDKNYQLEKSGYLHPVLKTCLEEKEKIVYLWTTEKLNQSQAFSFFADDDHYWTIFPEKDIREDAQEWLEKNYFQEEIEKFTELELNDESLQGEIDLREFTNLEYFNCENNKLTGLNVSGLSKLKEIYCSNNHLTSDKLNLSGLNSLETFFCKHNLLESIEPLLSANPKKMKYLKLTGNNFPEQDLSIFDSFTNLEILWIGNSERKTEKKIYNRFTGSLKHLNKLESLKELELGWTNVSDDLRCLPRGLETILCYGDAWKGYGTPENKSKKIIEKLKNFHEEGDKYNYQAWRKIYDEQKSLVNENKIYPELTWRKIPRKELLPLRLYNIKTKQIEKTTEKSDIKNYVIVSYVWNEYCQLPEEKIVVEWDGEYKNKLNSSGSKALNKAIQTCQHPDLNIDYLWMDQLCINQENSPEGIAERNREVPKMRQYYSNVDVTLIAIHSDLLEKVSGQMDKSRERENKQLVLDWPSILRIITNSEWFSRSWTFQEGWLSKQTIFMFDDILIDGRFMAAVWAFNQPNNTRHNQYDNIREFYEGSKKIATPIGWTYYKDGYSPKDVVSLRLDEALREVKKRGRGISIDGIYSILGLLPYGEQVKVNYKEWGHEYTKEELEEALVEVMEVAIRSGYGEPFAWHGEGNSTLGKCWIPAVDSDGSTKVAGGIEVKYVVPRGKEMDFTSIVSDKGILVNGSEYPIISCEGSIDSVDEKSIVDGGLHRREVKVSVGGDCQAEVALWGTRETLEKIRGKAEHSLVILNKNWKSRNNELFAVLVAASKDNIRHRIDLVRLGEGAEELEGMAGKELIIGGDNNQLEEQLETKIEIPPKK
jgi:Leucine-rich repeat (LRR) protein